MIILPYILEFGRLKVVNVYSHYDIPRTFLVHSSKLDYLLAFWIDETKTHDSWYYVPLGEDEIDRLENGLVQLRDVFLHKEIHEVDTPYDDKKATCRKVNSKDIDIEALPPKGFAIKKVANNQFGIEKRPINSFLLNSSSHEIRINKRRSKKAIEWEPIEYIFGAWRKLHNDILRSTQKIKDSISITPGPAFTGSYKMQFESSHNDEVIEGVKRLFHEIKTANGDIEKLKKLSTDLSIVETLLSNLAEYNLQFEIRTNSGSLIDNLDFNLIEETIAAINKHNQQKIPSDHVPQANEIRRIITYVKNKAEGLPFTAESEGIDHRQVGYYQAAAVMLGFSKNGVLTPIGWRLSETRNKLEVYGILLERFETSRCGWAWLKYCRVDSALDLKPETAVEFLRERSTGLSESTLKRRASTLRQWPITFKKKLS